MDQTWPVTQSKLGGSGVEEWSSTTWDRTSSTKKSSNLHSLTTTTKWWCSTASTKSRSLPSTQMYLRSEEWTQPSEREESLLSTISSQLRSMVLRISSTKQLRRESICLKLDKSTALSTSKTSSLSTSGIASLGRVSLTTTNATSDRLDRTPSNGIPLNASPAWTTQSALARQKSKSTLASGEWPRTPLK